MSRVYFRVIKDPELPCYNTGGSRHVQMQKFLEDTLTHGRRRVEMFSYWGMPLTEEVLRDKVMTIYTHRETIGYSPMELVAELARLFQLHAVSLRRHPDGSHVVFHKLTPTQPRFESYFDGEMKSRGYLRLHEPGPPKSLRKKGTTPEDIMQRNLSFEELRDLLSPQ